MPACLVVQVDVDDADLAALALWDAGAVAVAEERGALVAGFADDDAVRLASTRLGAAWPVRVVEVGEAWRDAWRAHAGPVRVGPLVVRPVGVAHDDRRPGDVVVDLEPGRVFGDGAHPTTRMALAEVVARVAPGGSVLDVGCGSGVLAVAAARLGAGRVVAVDVDPDAVAVTLANAARNGVAVEVSCTPVAEVPGRFDLVVANLGGAAVVADLAPALAARTAGVLVVGGLLAGGEERAVPDVAGLRAVARREEDGWRTLVLERR